MTAMSNSSTSPRALPLLYLAVYFLRMNHFTFGLNVPHNRRNMVYLATSRTPCTTISVSTSFQFTTRPKRHTTSVPILSSTRHNQSFLSMHMGHSHHKTHQDRNLPNTSSTGSSSSSASREVVVTLSPQKIGIQRRRRMALFVFCALAILGPPLLRHQQLREVDIGCFCISVLCLLVADPIRRGIKKMLKQLRQWSYGISKHSGTVVSPRQMLQSEGDRITVLGGVMNLILSGGKLAVGVTCHSSALVADAGHSLSDLFSDFVTLWAVQVGRLPPDEDHPYGHGKFEAIGSLFLSLTLLGTGLGVGAVSNKMLIEIVTLQRQGLLQQSTVAIPGLAAMLMAAISVVSKEWLYRVTRTVGERLKSQVIIANAWHHRSDAYSSILAVGSIGLARYVPGLVFVDAAAGIFVAGMICMTGAEILGESIKQLSDSSNDELAQQVLAVVSRNADVENVLRCRTRQMGSTSTVDLDIAMANGRPAFAARAVEERLKQQILRETEGVMDVDVRATSGLMICPLLEANATDLLNNLPVSVEDVESCVRDEIQIRHPEVESVERVRVHFQDTLRVNVDVDIRIDPTSSILQAGDLVEGLRATLESSNQINKASIFLDLNKRVADVSQSSSSDNN